MSRFLKRTPNRLLRHDLLILRNGFASAFSSTRDRILLVFGLGALALWSADAAVGPVRAATWPFWAGAAAAASAAAIVANAAERRLLWLVEQSPLCADALERRSRRGYHLFWHGAALPFLFLALLIPASQLPVGRSAPFLLAAAAAYAPGIVIGKGWSRIRIRAFGSAQPDRWRRGTTPECSTAWRKLAAIAAHRQTVAGARPGQAMLIAAATGGAAGAAAALAGHSPNPLLPMIVAGLCSLPPLLLLTRVDHEVVQFAAYAGFGPWSSLAAHALTAPLFAAGASLSALLLLPERGPGVAALVLTLCAGLLILLAARLWHFRLHAKRTAELIVQLELVAILLLGLTLLPLALLGLAAGSAALYRRTRTVTWRLA